MLVLLASYMYVPPKSAQCLHLMHLTFNQVVIRAFSSSVKKVSLSVITYQHQASVSQSQC